MRLSRRSSEKPPEAEEAPAAAPDARARPDFPIRGDSGDPGGFGLSGFVPLKGRRFPGQGEVSERVDPRR